MSLIADALKAAQWERSGADASSRRHRAASDLVGRPLPGPTPASRIPLPSTGLPTSLKVALGMLVLAVAGGGALVMHGRNSRRAAIDVTAAPAGTSAPAASQRELAQALLGGGQAVAAEPTEASSGEAWGEPGEGAAGDTTDEGGAYRGFVEEPVVAAALAEAAVRSDDDAGSEGAWVQTPAVAVEAVVNGRAGDATDRKPPAADAFHLTLAPGRPEGNEFGAAVQAQARGDHLRAVELYLLLVAQQPGNARVHNNLGTSYQALGRLELARQAYRRSVDLDPSYAAAWSNLAGVLATLGETEEARSALAESIRLDPANRATQVNLANQYAAAGSNAEARRLLEEVLRVEPEMAEAHYALARVMEASGDPAAVAEYRRFLEVAGDRFPRLVGPVRDRITQLEKGR